MFKRRRMRLRKGPLSFRAVMLISFIGFIFLTVQGVWLVNRGIEPTLLHIAETRTKEIATMAINDAILNKIVQNGDMNDIVKLVKDNDGSIKSYSVDQRVVSRVLFESATLVQSFLKDIEEGKTDRLNLPKEEQERINEEFQGGKDGIIQYIPLGQATNNSLLANLGPKIPVKFTIIGDVNTDLKQNVTAKGINNVWIEINIEVVVDVKVVIPFATKTAEVRRSIPVVGQYIPGEVPQFFNQSGQPIQPAVPLPSVTNGKK